MKRPYVIIGVSVLVATVCVAVGLTQPLGIVPFALAIVCLGWGLSIGLSSLLTDAELRRGLPRAARSMGREVPGEAAPPEAEPPEAEPPEAAVAGSLPPERCPKCSARLIRRMAVRGPKKGHQYLACRNWSATGCDYTWGSAEGEDLPSSPVPGLDGPDD